MHGDFSRDSFDARHRFSRVLMQQGRALLDADWNEQSSIHLYYLRALAVDLLGAHAGPGGGFEIRCRPTAGNPCDFTIGWGRYYVDGILVENPAPAPDAPGGDPSALGYREQPAYPLRKEEKLEPDTDYLVYLDVWERHLTHLEESHIRDAALGGPDTATRTRVLWQVKVARECERESGDADATCEDRLRDLVEVSPGRLAARARPAAHSGDPGVAVPGAGYRGAENRLYRVEIHDADADGATFKWSRNNGSVAFAIRGIAGNVVTLEPPGSRGGLAPGDWVEHIDDDHVLRGEPGALAIVEAVDPDAGAVTLSPSSRSVLPPFDGTRHPLLRRWDQRSDSVPVRQGSWIALEDGIEVRFEPGGTYRTGDYWMIPARTATGDILWPVETKPDGTVASGALPRHGIEHHYAPLARIRFEATGARCDDCRRIIEPLVKAPAVHRAKRAH